MEFSRQVNHMLHDEHMAVIALLERLDAYLRDHGPATPPAQDDGTTGALLRQLAGVIEGELTAHFAFEEEVLFPLLDDAGEGDMPAMLKQEHAAILPVARQVAELARAALAEGFDRDGWAEFHRLGSILVGELTDHAEKEEFGFLPVLEHVLDDEKDATLAADYAQRR